MIKIRELEFLVTDDKHGNEYIDNLKEEFLDKIETLTDNICEDLSEDTAL